MVPYDMELTNRQVTEGFSILQAIKNARIPVKSSIRLTHTVDNLEPKAKAVQSQHQEIRQEHQKENDDGELLYQFDERKVEGDVDPADAPSEVPADHEGANERFPVFDDAEAFQDDVEAMMEDTVEVDIYPFPEDELDEISVGLEKWRLEQEAGDGEEVDASNIEPGFRANDISSILFMLPEEYGM